MEALFINCKGCTERYPGCQDHCDKYKADRARLDELKAAEAVNRDLDAYFRVGIRKNLDAQAKCHQSRRGIRRLPGGRK